MVAAWLPHGLERPGPAGPAQHGAPWDRGSTVVRVVRARSGFDPAAGPVLLTLGSAVARAGQHPDQVSITGAGSAAASLDLAQSAGRISVWADPGDGVTARDVYSMLTICAALLLGRCGRAMVHAAGLVDPGGRGWLLAGDAQAGKTTTTLSLIREGWDFLSDDQLVLHHSPDDGNVMMEGWLRTFHPDEQWQSDVPSGRRTTLHPRLAGPGRPRSMAELGGILFPQVVRDEPTCLVPVAPAPALALLIRQSPWLLADRTAAPTLLRCLQAAANFPAYRLQLGLDTFGRGRRLADLLEGTTAASRPS
jgi:hypothetical protein